MQRRNFKDAMNEMCDHTVAKIQEHVETLTRLDKEQKVNSLNLDLLKWIQIFHERFFMLF